MNILLLGGTKFIGPRLVRTLDQYGHRAETFTRGREPLPDGHEHHIGDRNNGFSGLPNKTWDCVIDTSCYRPGQMHISVKFFAQRTRQYIFVSTVNVYKTLKVVDTLETALTQRRLAFERFRPINQTTYGALRAECERILKSAEDLDYLIVRPGYLTGPGDPSNRLGKIVHIIATNKEAELRGTPHDMWQLLDVRDLCQWIANAVDNKHFGTFNLVGPQSPIKIGHLIETLRPRFNPSFKPNWKPILDRRLENADTLDLMEWAALPSNLKHLYRISNKAAIATGLKCRPLVETAESSYSHFIDQTRKGS